MNPAEKARADDPERGDAAVEVLDPGGRLAPGDAAWLRGAAASAARLLNARGEVRVRVVGDVEMGAAHQRFAGVAGTTDVLTFDLTERAAAGGGPLDADLLVCFDEAARQASARGHETVRELLLYVVHGVLHCLGYDDHTDDGYDRMHAEEDRVLSALGVGPVFARGGAQGDGASAAGGGS